ncbi:MAG: type II secretion system protein [Clostridia bacterium]|jgi:type II secretory pathway pseudopilin PulG|nr:type II secretion system protein [Clostridia bacterium]
MINIKQKNGITLVSLIITIVIMGILSAIAITVSTNLTQKASDSKLISDLEVIQQAILQQYSKYKLTKDNSNLLGIKCNLQEVQDIATNLGINLVDIPDNYSNKEYYRLDMAALKHMKIDNITDEYIVNYISGEVINITVKRTSDNKPLYTKANSFV